MAAAAIQGVNHLRRRIQRRTWRIAVGAAAAAGAVVAVWVMFRIASDQIDGPATVDRFVWTLMGGAIIGVAAAITSRIATSRLIDRLGMTGGAKPPGFGQLFWPTVGTAVLAPIALIAVMGGGYLASWPEGYRDRIDGVVTDAASEPMAHTTTNVRLRKGANAQADIVTTIPQGAVVILDGRVNGDWTAVRYGYQQGWVARRYLEMEP